MGFLVVLVGLVVLALGVLAYGREALINPMLSSDVDEVGVSRVEDPTVTGAPEAIPEEEAPLEAAPEEEVAEEETDQFEAELAALLEEQAAAQLLEEQAAAQLAAQAELAAQEAAEVEAELMAKEEALDDEEAALPPADSTMYLSIPKLGVYGALVVDGEAGLELGAEHLPGTGFPWILGSNTYIAGHRIGFPGTGSDHIFFDLHALVPGDVITLSDSNGQVYTYLVSEALQVLPTDLSVTAPVGADVLTLQTCIEDFGDFVTLGPNWNVRYLVRAEKVS
jgi:sortase A